MNDKELRELALFVVSLKINPKWTEELMFEILKENPKLTKMWERGREDFEKANVKTKEVVQFT